MSATISCVVLSGTSSIPSWQISSGDAGARTAIGSDPAVAWQFSDREVQPKHAELYYDGAALYVCDLVNRGDVRIGGNAVTAGQWVPVPVGSELSIGQARLSVQQGNASSIPPPPAAKSKTSRTRAKASALPPVRTLVIGALVVVVALGVGGMFIYKKFRAASSAAQGVPVQQSAAARTSPRPQSVDHLFPASGSEIRTRDDFSKRTDPEAQKKVEQKMEGSSGNTLLERPEPTTLEGKAAAAAIDGDVTLARELYGQLVQQDPSNPAFRVALELVERQRLERCRLLGKGACE